MNKIIKPCCNFLAASVICFVNVPWTLLTYTVATDAILGGSIFDENAVKSNISCFLCLMIGCDIELVSSDVILSDL